MPYLTLATSPSSTKNDQCGAGVAISPFSSLWSAWNKSAAMSPIRSINYNNPTIPRHLNWQGF
jgi:hypothetical protein